MTMMFGRESFSRSCKAVDLTSISKIVGAYLAGGVNAMGGWGVNVAGGAQAANRTINTMRMLFRCMLFNQKGRHTGLPLQIYYCEIFPTKPNSGAIFLIA